MEAWQAPALGAVCGGALAVVLVFAARRLVRPGWSRTGALAVVAAVFVVAGAAAPAVRSPDRTAGRPLAVADPLGAAKDGLASADEARRLAAIRELSTLAYRHRGRAPLVVDALSTFVRDRAPAAAGCGSAPPATDVAAALTVIGTPLHRAPADLHGACLARTDLTGLAFDRANLSGADLTGAVCVQMSFSDSDLTHARLVGARFSRAGLAGSDLTGADLTRASFANSALNDAVLDDVRVDHTDFTGVRWSEGTRWPAAHEQAVNAASSFDTTDFVVGPLLLTDG